MSLIDRDTLPHSWQMETNGNHWFVDGRDVDAAPVVCCKRCEHVLKTYGKTVLCDLEDWRPGDFGCVHFTPKAS